MKNLNNYIIEKLIVNNTLQNGYTKEEEYDKVLNYLYDNFFLEGNTSQYQSRITAEFSKWVYDNDIKNIDKLEIYIFSDNKNVLKFQQK